MQFFNLLADRVNQLWRNTNYDDLQFADCAMEALRLLPPREHISMEDIVKWTVETNAIPTQTDRDENFGHPPMTVFFGGDFRIEALFWIVGLPAVHQHGFSGAFHVLEGSSLHCQYQFELHKKLTTRLLIGDVNLENMELLKAGASRMIRGGQDFIHATFHLDRPSVSIVVRTHRDQEHLPQYSYLPPSIAYDPYEIPALVLRRCQILKMLAASEQFEMLGRSFRHVCEFDDAATIFFALQKLYPMLGPKNRDKLLSMVQRRYPELASAARTALAYDERRDKILKLRRKVIDPELQFFLAMLLYVKNREVMLGVVRQAFPQKDPAALLLEWIKKLSVETDALNGMNEGWVALVEWQLARLGPQEMRNRWSARVSSGQRNEKALFDDAFRDMQKHWVLQPLFEHSEFLSGGVL